MNCAGLFSKKTVFVRPSLPTGEQVFEDLSNAPDDDIAFKIFSKDDDCQGNEVNVKSPKTYEKLKLYLKTREYLKSLSIAMPARENSLKEDKNEIERLAKNLRQQAQEALNT